MEVQPVHQMNWSLILMTIHRVTGRVYLPRPFFIGYARGLCNETEASSRSMVLSLVGWAKILNFKREE
jgi:hypothetical protein